MPLIGRGSETFYVDNTRRRLSNCRRKLLAWQQAMEDVRRCGVGVRLISVCLTYRDGDHVPSGSDVTDFCLKIRDRLGHRLFGYCWVLEMQERGVPHWHLILGVTAGALIPKPDTADASGFCLWPWGSSSVGIAYSVQYLFRYFGKVRQKQGLPKGWRAYCAVVTRRASFISSGFHGGIDGARWAFRFWNLPAWLRERLIQMGLFQLGLLPVRLDGRHWLCCGFVFESPFVFITRGLEWLEA